MANKGVNPFAQYTDETIVAPEGKNKMFEDVPTKTTDKQTAYSMQQEETRSKRIQIVVKPSSNDALDRLVEEGKIKSKNDLINFLIEDFISRH